MFQAVTSHWVKAGRWKVKKNYRVGGQRLLEYVQTFPSWWAPSLRGRKRVEALADSIPPLFVYWLFANMLHYEPRRVLDLYAGIGGWVLGIALYTSHGFSYTAVEIDKERCRALEHSLRILNHEHYIDIDYEIVCSDARRYVSEELGSNDFDLVARSPPCEDVTSLRRLAKGREAGTYELTRVYLEAVEKTRPVLAVYENVLDKELQRLLRARGFLVQVYDMSTIIPQTRKRLIAYKTDP